MPSEPKPLHLPPSETILLTQLRSTDGKIDTLLPLLSLLDSPEDNNSDLGRALIDVLNRVMQEMQQIRDLREDVQRDLSQMRSEISGQSQGHAEAARGQARIEQRLAHILGLRSPPMG